jgi:hypothetical protein
MRQWVTVGSILGEAMHVLTLIVARQTPMDTLGAEWCGNCSIVRWASQLMSAVIAHSHMRRIRPRTAKQGSETPAMFCLSSFPLAQAHAMRLRSRP